MMRGETDYRACPIKAYRRLYMIHLKMVKYINPSVKSCNPSSYNVLNKSTILLIL